MCMVFADGMTIVMSYVVHYCKNSSIDDMKKERMTRIRSFFMCVLFYCCLFAEYMILSA